MGSPNKKDKDDLVTKGLACVFYLQKSDLQPPTPPPPPPKKNVVCFELPPPTIYPLSMGWLLLVRTYAVDFYVGHCCDVLALSKKLCKSLTKVVFNVESLTQMVPFNCTL